MGKLSCNLEGYLDDSKFSEPMPWVGIYVAMASLACLSAMAYDALVAIRHKKLYFPSGYFSLNSTTLTILAAAVKLPMDLNTVMPHSHDQLSKLSSSVLLCVAMGNFMPSLGTMENKEITMNIMALTILLITLIANVSIQMGTGAIYVFHIEHAVIMFFMVSLLILLVFSALTVPTTRKILKKKYKLGHQQAKDEHSDDTERFEVGKLTKNIKRLWMMARTLNPQYVMARLATSASSGVLCLLSALILVEAVLRSHMEAGSSKFCNGESDYKWSIMLILVIQSSAVGVGIIAPIGRWLAATNLKCNSKGRGKGHWKNEFRLEKFWTKGLMELKESPFALRVRGHQCRKLVHELKNLFLDFCIRTQTAVVLMSKSVQLISTFFASMVNCLYQCVRRKRKKNVSHSSELNQETGSSECATSTKLDSNHFVLHLEGEEKFVELLARNSNEATDCCIKWGRKRKPTSLLQMLNKYTMTESFSGVREFDIDQVPSLASEENSSSWALTVVTLTGIAIALPNIDKHRIKSLLDGVSQGLRYVRIIENNLDGKQRLLNNRKAADIMWIGVDLYNKWLDIDLSKLASEERSPKEILKKLADSGKDYVMDFKKQASVFGNGENHIQWPVKVLAANSMYRFSQTILKNNYNNKQTGEQLFEWLCQTISDVLGACLTNLPYTLSAMCFSNAIKVMKNIYKAAYLLGETEDILKILGQQALPDLNLDQMPFIENWKILAKCKPSFLPSTASDNNA